MLWWEAARPHHDAPASSPESATAVTQSQCVGTVWRCSSVHHAYPQSKKEGFELKYKEALIGGAALDATGVPLPDATLDTCKSTDAVLLAAIGGRASRVPPRVFDRIILECVLSMHPLANCGFHCSNHLSAPAWAAGRRWDVSAPAAAYLVDHGVDRDTHAGISGTISPRTSARSVACSASAPALR